MEEGKQRKVWLWHEHVWRKWKFHGRNGFSWTFPSWRRSQKQCLIETTPSQSQSVIRSILSFQPLIPTVTHSFQSLYSIIYFNFKCSLCFINICDEVYSGKHLKLPKFMYWSRQARETKWTAWQLIYSSLYFHAPLTLLCNLRFRSQQHKGITTLRDVTHIFLYTCMVFRSQSL